MMRRGSFEVCSERFAVEEPSGRGRGLPGHVNSRTLSIVQCNRIRWMPNSYLSDAVLLVSCQLMMMATGHAGG
jgi:hypothetical protein